MFVRPEIGPLRKRFDRIVIAPYNASGPNVDPNNGCEIDLSLCRLLRGRGKAILRNTPFALKSKSRNNYAREVGSAFLNYGPKAIPRALLWCLQAATSQYWANNSRFRKSDTVIFYTYWNTGITKGICEATKEIPKWYAVTRVHGYDLYPERGVPAYLPFRPQIYSSLDRTYTISKHGYDFLVQRGVPENRLALARLGIEDPGFLNRFSTDGKFRVVSCSFLARVKRVPLLARALCEFARTCEGLQIEWHHLGDGSDRDLVEQALADKPENLKTFLLGQLTNEKVMEYYRNNCSDLFVHLSESEGIPVSMMEVSAIGLPILATDVGGVGEIVTQCNGLLLRGPITETDVVNGLRKYYDMPQVKKNQMSTGGRSAWAEHFSAQTNHSEFAEDLARLVESKFDPR